MANLVGSIAVSLGLDAAEYTQGLTKAEYQAQKTARAIVANLESITGAVKATAAAIGLGFGVHELVAWGEEVTHNAEQLHNLSIETGSSIESLSRLENITRISGQSFDTTKTILERFTAGLGGAETQGSKVRQVMELLGVSAKDPVEALTKVAEKLNTFADGTNKAALARAAFGRDGVAFLASLKAIGEAQDVSATKTKEQIDQAVRLAESFRTMQVQSTLVRDAFLNNVVPAIATMITQFNLAREAGQSFFQSLLLAGTGVGQGSSLTEAILYQMKEVNRIQKAINAEKDKPIRLPAFASLGEDDLAKAKAKLQVLLDFERQQDADRIRRLGGAPSNEVLGQAPALPDTAALRASLDAELTALRSQSAQEKALLAERNEVIQGLFDQSLISVKQYNDEKQRAIQQDLANTTVLYEREIAAIRRFAGTPGLTPSERAGAQKDLAIATAQYTLSAIKAQQESIKATNDGTKANQAFGDSVIELSAQVAEMNGNMAEAVRLRQTFSSATLQRAQLGLSGGPGAVADYDAIQRQKEAQAALNEKTRDYGYITDALSIKQARLDLLQQTGLTSEIAQLTGRAEIARQYIPLLEAQIRLEQEAALKLKEGSPERIKALLDIERQKVAIEQLKIETNALANAFDRIGADAFTQFLDDVSSKTKSVSQAFRDMANSIEKSFMHLINEQIAKQLYASLFGSQGAAGGSPGSWLTEILKMAGLSGTGSAGASSGPSFDWASAAASFGESGFASGTNFAPGGWSMVGERGPEMIRLPRGSQVMSNADMRGGGMGGYQITQVINVMPGASRQTASQAAGEAGRALTYAQRTQ